MNFNKNISPFVWGQKIKQVYPSFMQESFDVNTKRLGWFGEDSNIDQFDFNNYLTYKQNFLDIFFIEKYKDKINWYWTSLYQSLPEFFIEKYQEKVSWECISCNQHLSNKFLAKHIDKLYLNELMKNSNVNQEFIEKLQLLK